MGKCVPRKKKKKSNCHIMLGENCFGNRSYRKIVSFSINKIGLNK